MTTHTIEPRHHVSWKAAGLALAGAGIAAAAAYGITTAMSGDAAPTAPAREGSSTVITEGARDSWEGRISPDTVRGTDQGVRDAWTSSSLPEEKLLQLR